MKTVNANYGYDTVPARPEDRRWYRHPRFPLLPIIDTDPGDRWNTARFSFSWLNLRLWSLDTFGFSLEAEVADTGIRLGAILPYLRVVVWVLPFPMRWHRRFLRRRPAGERIGFGARW